MQVIIVIVVRRGAGVTGMSTPSSSSSSEHISVPVEKDQHRGLEAVFHLNPTEPHGYQVRKSSLLL